MSTPVFSFKYTPRPFGFIPVVYGKPLFMNSADLPASFNKLEAYLDDKPLSISQWSNVKFTPVIQGEFYNNSSSISYDYVNKELNYIISVEALALGDSNINGNVSQNISIHAQYHHPDYGPLTASISLVDFTIVNHQDEIYIDVVKVARDIEDTYAVTVVPRYRSTNEPVYLRPNWITAQDARTNKGVQIARFGIDSPTSIVEGQITMRYLKNLKSKWTFYIPWKNLSPDVPTLMSHVELDNSYGVNFPAVSEDSWWGTEPTA